MERVGGSVQGGVGSRVAWSIHAPVKAMQEVRRNHPVHDVATVMEEGS